MAKKTMPKGMALPFGKGGGPKPGTKADMMEDKMEGHMKKPMAGHGKGKPPGRGSPRGR